MLKFIAKIVAKFRHYVDEEQSRLYVLARDAELKAMGLVHGVENKVEGLFHHGEEVVQGEVKKVEQAAKDLK